MGEKKKRDINRFFIPILFLVILGLAVLNHVHNAIELRELGIPNSDSIYHALQFQETLIISIYFTVPFGILFIFSNKVIYGVFRRIFIFYVGILFIYLSFGFAGFFRVFFWLASNDRFKRYDLDLFNSRRFNNGKNVSTHFNQIQRQEKCCGISNVNDWINLDDDVGFLPSSCCTNSTSFCGYNILKDMNWANVTKEFKRGYNDTIELYRNKTRPEFKPPDGLIHTKGCGSRMYPYIKKIAIHVLIYFCILLPACIFMIIGFIVTISIRNVTPVDNTMLHWEKRFNETEKNLFETNLILMENILHPIYADGKEHRFLHI